jgi:hypothetical protein
VSKPWAAEEDQLLCHFHNQFGAKWAKFTHHFQGRSASNIKNRWYSHLKGMIFQTKKIELPSRRVYFRTKVRCDRSSANAKYSIFLALFNYPCCYSVKLLCYLCNLFKLTLKN